MGEAVDLPHPPARPPHWLSPALARDVQSLRTISANGVGHHHLEQICSIEHLAFKANLAERVIDQIIPGLIYVDMDASLLWTVGCPQGGRSRSPNLKRQASVVVEIDAFVDVNVVMRAAELVVQWL